MQPKQCSRQYLKNRAVNIVAVSKTLFLLMAIFCQFSKYIQQLSDNIHWVDTMNPKLYSVRRATDGIPNSSVSMLMALCVQVIFVPLVFDHYQLTQQSMAGSKWYRAIGCNL